MLVEVIRLATRVMWLEQSFVEALMGCHPGRPLISAVLLALLCDVRAGCFARGCNHVSDVKIFHDDDVAIPHYF